MIESYLKYLDDIDKKLKLYFEEQSSYICCHKGCGKCCKQVELLYSEMEFRHIYQGLINFKPEVQNLVLNKIDKIIKEKQAHNETKPNEKFVYDCPFLVNDECCVYDYRGLICRYFGLISFSSFDIEQKPKIPFCAYEGLNYSKILDRFNDKISFSVLSNSDTVQEPKAYDVDYATLVNEDVEKKYNFCFGEIKPLIDWFIQWKEQIIDIIEQ